MVEWLGYAMHLFPAVILIKNEDRKKKKNEDGPSHGSDKVWPWPFMAQLSAFRRKTRVTWRALFLAGGNTQQWGLREPEYPKRAYSVGNTLIVELTR